MPLKRVSIPSPNFSSRDGAGVRLIVLHTAEGAQTYQELGHFFQGPVQASSHAGVDDASPNTAGQYVDDSEKAWAVVSYNSVSVSLEQCAFAAWTTAEWMQHPNLLANTAAWIREEAAKFNIPIVKLTPIEAQGSGRGVCQHRDLGVNGGGHSDCGDGFPIDHVLELARAGTTPKPPKPDTGTATASVSMHLERKAGVWEVHGTAGHAHFGGPDKWDEAIIGVNLKTGKWRIRRRGASRP